MPAERAGYTVTMFLVDVSPSMEKLRTIELPPGPEGEPHTAEITHLEWALQFVKLKIQEMIFNGRKTDQCGVVIFGSEETSNVINEEHGGYDHVSEFIPIGQPNATTLAKLDTLKSSTIAGDPIDALIVGIETQAQYLSSKKTWTRKIVLTTDGENPIEVEDWEETAEKMNILDIIFTLVGIDFDDEDFPYIEPDKSNFKKANEKFYRHFVSKLTNGVIGTCALALREIARPDIKQVKSVLMGTTLRLGDIDTRPDEAVEIMVKTSKCTALSRPKGWKKFTVRPDDEEMSLTEEERRNRDQAFAQLKMRSEYYIESETKADGDGDVKMEDEELLLERDADDESLQKGEGRPEHVEKVDREQLVKGFKYGTTYTPCPDGQFPRLPTRKGIDICGFFPSKNFRRELSMGEVQYVWADPSSPQQQVAFSSIVQAMYEKGVMAIARWVSKDSMDPKMGVLKSTIFNEVDCLLWTQMPFADDIRRYTFASLDNLITKNGVRITEHPYLPTEKQLEAMDYFVDCMDLSDAGNKDEEGNRVPWFDTLLSYNPAIHRTKQALFHSAVVTDLTTNPLPPPHPEIMKYFDPPRRVLKRSREAMEECKDVFKVKEVRKKVARARQGGHEHAEAGDDDLILLDRTGPTPPTSPVKNIESATPANVNVTPNRGKGKTPTTAEDSETEPESEAEEELLLNKKPDASGPVSAGGRHPLLTPACSMSPSPAQKRDTDVDSLDVFDAGRAPGMIIGTTHPLVDFQKSLEKDDVVTKAVEDLGVVIAEIIGWPFARRRSKEMVEAMEAMRDTALKEDEIDAWNGFLQGLKEKCEPKIGGNKDFWSKVKEAGRALSLISDKEAKEYGGTSSVTEQRAQEFVA